MSAEGTAFADRYGPWAIIAGASDGVGSAFAHAMAERGLNVVLLARRQALLDEVAEAIRHKTGVETRTAAVDLSLPDAMAKIASATDGLDVGMVIYCAGADPLYEPFLNHPVDIPVAMIQRNCVVPMRMFHHFAQPMVERGRGGLMLLSSGAGLRGGANMVGYAATKAFDIVMAESLWAELESRGVDVLSLVLGGTDTPSLRRVLARHGQIAGEDDPVPIPGIATPEQVVQEGLANLTNGPTWLVSEEQREHARQLGAMTRSEAVRAMQERAAALMATAHNPEASS
jgi:short-subunit dehydrogenase